jgi:hypothetical protein
MLTISAKQMATLKRRREQWFEEWIVTYLRDADPEYCAMLGDEAIAGVAQQAMEKTRQYGIRDQYDVLRYVGFMLVLGFDFDERLDWAGEILNDIQFAAATRLAMIDDELDGPDDDDDESVEASDATGYV